MESLIHELDRLWPGAAKLITAIGPQVPVAFRMDGSQLRNHVPGIPQTPLEIGLRKTLDLFAQLMEKGRLSA
jgi:hypothetical protein